MELTPRQADVLLLIRNYRHLHGYAPSISDIATSLGLCRATVVCHLDRMIKKGLIRKTPGLHRSLEVIEDNQGSAPKPMAKKMKVPDMSALDWLRASG